MPAPKHAWHAAPANAYVYWGNTTTNTIGRANLDGTGVNQSFIAGLKGVRGVAVNSTHIFWAMSFTTTVELRDHLDRAGEPERHEPQLRLHHRSREPGRAGVRGRLASPAGGGWCASHAPARPRCPAATPARIGYGAPAPIRWFKSSSC